MEAQKEKEESMYAIFELYRKREVKL